ncbi:amidohydrolase family protein [Fodinicurvata sediminis]|uniref:amidohydrolase family protein n=1 Tax=Fodinicurvata sediminis TaxID=1121832 RepID=UPI0003B797CD|nr:amidohydrolase family protein [Fodinicurvata sediminis]
MSDAIPVTPGPVAEPSKPATQLPKHACDSHAHVFDPEGGTPLAPGSEYRPSHAPLERYERLLQHLGFARAVLVQPSVYGTNNRFMMECLKKKGPTGDDSFRGIAVVDSSVTDAELDEMHRVGVRGIRINLVYGGGVDFEVLTDLVNRIAPLGWHVQFLVDLSKLPDFAQRVEALPVPFVVDHIGHFPVSLGAELPAFRDLVSLVRESRAWVKIIGPNRISARQTPPFDDVKPLVDPLVEANPNQLLFGTDWPHVKLSTPIPDDGSLVDEFAKWVPDEAIRKRILVDNPARLYGFGG